jgi:hypothetical protein
MTLSIDTLAELVMDSVPNRTVTDLGPLIVAILSGEEPGFDWSVVGSASLYQPRGKRAWIDVGAGYKNYATVTRGQLVRQALKVLQDWGEQKWYPWSKVRHGKYSEIAHPLFFKPYCGWGTYVDISSCYYSIYSRLPYVFEYDPLLDCLTGPEETFGDLLPPELAGDKLGRNMVVGIWRATKMTRIRGCQFTETRTDGKLRHPQAWAVIATWIHFFARLAVELGCVYYNTDGAIFPNQQAADYWIEQIINHGFWAKTKSVGAVSVWGLGRYAFGTIRPIQEGQGASTIVDLTPGPTLCGRYARLTIAGH